MIYGLGSIGYEKDTGMVGLALMVGGNRPVNSTRASSDDTP
jgi:hypothetical protein